VQGNDGDGTVHFVFSSHAVVPYAIEKNDRAFFIFQVLLQCATDVCPGRDIPLDSRLAHPQAEMANRGRPSAMAAPSPAKQERAKAAPLSSGAPFS
ncbi:MAG: hypothetical protein RR283_15740, partial [Comamonas sp.]